MAIQQNRVLGILSETWEEQANFLAARQLVRRSSQSLPSLRGRKIAGIFLVTQNLSCSLLPFLPSSFPFATMHWCQGWPIAISLACENAMGYIVAAISKTKSLLQNLPLLTQLRLIPSSVPIFRHPQNLNPISSSDYIQPDEPTTSNSAKSTARSKVKMKVSWFHIQEYCTKQSISTWDSSRLNQCRSDTWAFCWNREPSMMHHLCCVV